MPIDMTMLVFFLGNVFGQAEKPWLWTEKNRRHCSEMLRTQALCRPSSQQSSEANS